MAARRGDVHDPDRIAKRSSRKQAGAPRRRRARLWGNGIRARRGRGSHHHPTRASEPHTDGLRGHRVLVIRVLLADDDDCFVAALAALLATDGRLLVIGRAHNGREAVELATTHSPDVVLMDIDMPVMDGIEATRSRPLERSGLHRPDAPRRIKRRVHMETGSTGERNEGGQSDEPNKAAARQRVRNLTRRCGS
jgi:hypothetical protein